MGAQSHTEPHVELRRVIDLAQNTRHTHKINNIATVSSRIIYGNHKGSTVELRRAIAKFAQDRQQSRKSPVELHTSEYIPRVSYAKHTEPLVEPRGAFVNFTKRAGSNPQRKL